MNFPEKVKELRLKKNLTQTELGNLIGVRKQAIIAYEKGTSYPRNKEMWNNLANALDVDLNYLRTETDDFMSEVGEKYGSRGMRQARLIMDETAELFAGGELSPEDEEAFVKEMQIIFMDAKENAKKYTPKKYRKDEAAGASTDNATGKGKAKKSAEKSSGNVS